ncbi:MAG: hypothetical protein WCI36_01925 [bacterium]
MKKQKSKIILSAVAALLFAGFFASNALANGNATISWTAPTTNEDTTTLTDLAGYRIFYDTAALDCTAWDAAADAAARLTTPLASVAHVDVTEAATLRDSAATTKRGYSFTTGALLTPGLTYNFTVVAYDTSGNYSKCINDAGANKTASKTIFRSGNIKNSGLGSGVVNIIDLSMLANNFGKGYGALAGTPWCRIAGHPEDLNGDCRVNISDLSILASEFGLAN